MSHSLRERFDGFVQALGGVPSAAAFERLRAAYAEPHRHYHTLAHVEACLSWLDWAWSQAEHPHDLALALAYHDVIYDPARRDNEERSAAFARAELLSQGLSEASVMRIEASILATRSHQASTRDAALVVDIDLAILGAPPDAFARFEAEVREEYRAIDPLTYARGRLRVLEGFLAREPLYVTPFFASELTVQARANLSSAVRRWHGLAEQLARGV